MPSSDSLDSLTTLGGQQLRQRKFSGTSFRGHYLNYATFVGVEFSDCDLSEIDAKLASFIECRFDNCKWDNANLQFTRFENCIFHDAKKEVVIESTSMGGCRMRECDFFLGSTLRFKNSSARDAEFSKTRFGHLDLTDSSIEGANVTSSQFEELNISYASCTGACLLDNEYGKLIFSLPSFFLVIGSWQFLASDRIVLLNFDQGNPITERSGSEEIFDLLSVHLRQEIAQKNSIWRVANGILSLGLSRGYMEGRAQEICEMIAAELASSDLPDEQLIDEVSLLLSAMIAVDFRNNRLLKTVTELAGVLYGVRDQVHPKLWGEFERRRDAYRRLVLEEYSVKFKFGSLSLENPEDLRKAIEFISRAQNLAPEIATIKSPKLYSGSLIVDLLTAAQSVPWWVAIAVTIGAGTRISVNFDVNKMLEQFGAAISYIAKRKRRNEIDELASLASEYEIYFVFDDLSPNSEGVKAVSLSPATLSSLTTHQSRDNR